MYEESLSSLETVIGKPLNKGFISDLPGYTWTKLITIWIPALLSTFLVTRQWFGTDIECAEFDSSSQKCIEWIISTKTQDEWSNETDYSRLYEVSLPLQVLVCLIPLLLWHLTTKRHLVAALTITSNFLSDVLTEFYQHITEFQQLQQQQLKVNKKQHALKKQQRKSPFAKVRKLKKKELKQKITGHIEKYLGSIDKWIKEINLSRRIILHTSCELLVFFLCLIFHIYFRETSSEKYYCLQHEQIGRHTNCAIPPLDINHNINILCTSGLMIISISHLLRILYECWCVSVGKKPNYEILTHIPYSLELPTVKYDSQNKFHRRSYHTLEAYILLNQSLVERLSICAVLKSKFEQDAIRQIKITTDTVHETINLTPKPKIREISEKDIESESADDSECGEEDNDGGISGFDLMETDDIRNMDSTSECTYSQSDDLQCESTVTCDSAIDVNDTQSIQSISESVEDVYEEKSEMNVETQSSNENTQDHDRTQIKTEAGDYELDEKSESSTQDLREQPQVEFIENKDGEILLDRSKPTAMPDQKSFEESDIEETNDKYESTEEMQSKDAEETQHNYKDDNNDEEIQYASKDSDHDNEILDKSDIEDSIFNYDDTSVNEGLEVEGFEVKSVESTKENIMPDDTTYTDPEDKNPDGAEFEIETEGAINAKSDEESVEENDKSANDFTDKHCDEIETEGAINAKSDEESVEENEKSANDFSDEHCDEIETEGTAKSDEESVEENEKSANDFIHEHCDENSISEECSLKSNHDSSINSDTESVRSDHDEFDELVTVSVFKIQVRGRLSNATGIGDETILCEDIQEIEVTETTVKRGNEIVDVKTEYKHLGDGELVDISDYKVVSDMDLGELAQIENKENDEFLQNEMDVDSLNAQDDNNDFSDSLNAQDDNNDYSDDTFEKDSDDVDQNEEFENDNDIEEDIEYDDNDEYDNDEEIDNTNYHVVERNDSVEHNDSENESAENKSVKIPINDEKSDNSKEENSDSKQDINSEIIEETEGKESNLDVEIHNCQAEHFEINHQHDEASSSNEAETMESSLKEHHEILEHDKVEDDVTENITEDIEIEMVHDRNNKISNEHEMDIRTKSELPANFIDQGMTCDNLDHGITAIENEDDTLEKSVSNLNDSLQSEHLHEDTSDIIIPNSSPNDETTEANDSNQNINSSIANNTTSPVENVQQEDNDTCEKTAHVMSANEANNDEDCNENSNKNLNDVMTEVDNMETLKEETVETSDMESFNGHEEITATIDTENAEDKLSANDENDKNIIEYKHSSNSVECGDKSQIELSEKYHNDQSTNEQMRIDEKETVYMCEQLNAPEQQYVINEVSPSDTDRLKLINEANTDVDIDNDNIKHDDEISVKVGMSSDLTSQHEVNNYEYAGKVDNLPTAAEQQCAVSTISVSNELKLIDDAHSGLDIATAENTTVVHVIASENEGNSVTMDTVQSSIDRTISLDDQGYGTWMDESISLTKSQELEENDTLPTEESFRGKLIGRSSLRTQSSNIWAEPDQEYRDERNIEDQISKEYEKLLAKYNKKDDEYVSDEDREDSIPRISQSASFELYEDVQESGDLNKNINVTFQVGSGEFKDNNNKSNVIMGQQISYHEQETSASDIKTKPETENIAHISIDDASYDKGLNIISHMKSENGDCIYHTSTEISKILNTAIVTEQTPYKEIEIDTTTLTNEPNENELITTGVDSMFDKDLNGKPVTLEFRNEDNGSESNTFTGVGQITQPETTMSLECAIIDNVSMNNQQSPALLAANANASVINEESPEVINPNTDISNNKKDLFTMKADHLEDKSITAGDPHTLKVSAKVAVAAGPESSTENGITSDTCAITNNKSSEQVKNAIVNENIDLASAPKGVKSKAIDQAHYSTVDKANSKRENTDIQINRETVYNAGVESRSLGLNMDGSLSESHKLIKEFGKDIKVQLQEAERLKTVARNDNFGKKSDKINKSVTWADTVNTGTLTTADLTKISQTGVIKDNQDIDKAHKIEPTTSGHTKSIDDNNANNRLYDNLKYREGLQKETKMEAKDDQVNNSQMNLAAESDGEKEASLLEDLFAEMNKLAFRNTDTIKQYYQPSIQNASACDICDSVQHIESEIKTLGDIANTENISAKEGATYTKRDPSVVASIKSQGYQPKMTAEKAEIPIVDITQKSMSKTNRQNYATDTLAKTDHFLTLKYIEQSGKSDQQTKLSNPDLKTSSDLPLVASSISQDNNSSFIDYRNQDKPSIPCNQQSTLPITSKPLVGQDNTVSNMVVNNDGCGRNPLVNVQICQQDVNRIIQNYVTDNKPAKDGNLQVCFCDICTNKYMEVDGNGSSRFVKKSCPMDVIARSRELLRKTEKEVEESMAVWPYPLDSPLRSGNAAYKKPVETKYNKIYTDYSRAPPKNDIDRLAQKMVDIERTNSEIARLKNNMRLRESTKMKARTMSLEEYDIPQPRRFNKFSKTDGLQSNSSTPARERSPRPRDSSPRSITSSRSQSPISRKYNVRSRSPSPSDISRPKSPLWRSRLQQRPSPSTYQQSPPISPRDASASKTCSSAPGRTRSPVSPRARPITPTRTFQPINDLPVSKPVTIYSPPIKSTSVVIPGKQNPVLLPRSDWVQTYMNEEKSRLERLAQLDARIRIMEEEMKST